LNAFRSALQNSQNSAVSVAVIGDSIFDYGNPSDPTTYPNGPVVQLTRSLQNVYGTHGTGIIPIGSNGGLATNPEWTLHGTVTTVNDLGPSQSGTGAFGSTFKMTGGGNYVELTPQFGDSLRVYMESTTDSGGCNVLVDGVTTLVGNTTSGSPAAIVATIGSLSADVHTVFIGAPGSGSCYLYGVEFTYGSTGVTVHKLAHGYARSEAWGANTATQLAYIAQMSPVPAAAIVALGVNDSTNGTGTTASQYRSNISNILTYLRTLNPQMAILVADENNVQTPGTVLPQTTIRTSEQAVAQQFGASYLSIADAWGAYATANALGLMASDGVHITSKGGLSQAGLLTTTMVGYGLTQSTSFPCPIPGTPTLSAQSGAGSGATVNWAGGYALSNCNFTFGLTTGTSPAAGQLVHIAFSSAFSSSPGCVVSPTGTESSLSLPVVPQVSTTGVTVDTTSTPAAGMTYYYTIHCAM
jgi:hypothetical protein